MKPIQTPQGLRQIVRLYKLDGEPFGTFYLGDGTVAKPDARGFLIVDSKDVPALAAAGWAVHQDQSDEGPAALGETNDGNSAPEIAGS